MIIGLLMEEKGAILFIDDDAEDHMLFKTVLNEIAPLHPIVLFEKGQDAIDYLRDSAAPPFLIISEIRMNGMDGLELRRQIDDDPFLRNRTIPFVFFTSPINEFLVDDVYKLTVQGLFEKPAIWHR